MTFARDEGGSLALVTLLLLPLLLVVLTGVLELGVLRVVAERARIAADLAAVTAVNDLDEGYLAATGRIRPAADAPSVAREHLAFGLEALSASLASTPGAIAGSADVGVFPTADLVDPLSGRSYPGPTVRIAVDLPVLTPGLAALMARPITVIHLFSASSAR
jgi:Flp pilus assembly protein TadG